MTLVFSILIVIGFTFIFLFAIFIRWSDAIDYNRKMKNDTDKIKITFQQFYDFYHADPTKWTLEDNTATYEHTFPATLTQYGFIENSRSYHIHFKTSADLIKYHRFLKNLLQTKAEQRLNECTIRFLEDVSEDIQKLKIKAAKEIQQGMISEQMTIECIKKGESLDDCRRKI